METKTKDKRKVLLFIPLLVLPFMALAFYAMGGGQGTTPPAQQVARQGINTSLPDASLNKKDEPQDKMGFYQQAQRDSLVKSNDKGIKSVADRLGFNAQQEDPQTRAINQKLEALNREINKPVETSGYRTGTVPARPQPSSIGSDVDRLEALMKTMQGEKGEDPEMRQLNDMMDKILAIQNPDLVPQKTVKPAAAEAETKFRAIPAEIAGNQKAVQGASIKLRLQDTITLSGQLIPKGHEITGTCRITNQRLLLDIKNIRLGTSIIPVDLSVYSLDGMAGINAPEAELAGAAGMGADDAVRSIGMYGIDQSIATQVAGAGIDAAKSLFSKKIRKIKVKLEAGTAVLLRNNQLKNR